MNYLFLQKYFKKQNINAYKTKVNNISINNFNASDLMTVHVLTNYMWNLLNIQLKIILNIKICAGFEKNKYIYELNHTDLNDYILIHLFLRFKMEKYAYQIRISSGNKFNHRFSFGSGLYVNNIRFILVLHGYFITLMDLILIYL